MRPNPVLKARTNHHLFHRVFVYGTLMRGQLNHHWMRGAERLGGARSPRGFSLWSLGQYPVACPEGVGCIRGEVYRLDPAHLYRLDVLEEHPQFYQRRQVATRYGMAWIYFQPKPPGGAHRLPGGDWRRNRPAVEFRRGFQGVEATQGRQMDRTG